MSDSVSNSIAPEWLYRAKLDRVIDGDTIDVTLDLGFSIYNSNQRIRLLGIDTAETYGVKHTSDEYARGVTHRRFVDMWFLDAIDEYEGEWPLAIRTEKDEKGKYGRWLAYVFRQSDGRSLQRALLDEFGDEVKA